MLAYAIGTDRSVASVPVFLVWRVAATGPEAATELAMPNG
jgi:hypothetical protein